MISNSQSEASWALFYNTMIDGGFKNVEMVISGAHEGQVNAIQKCFTDLVWQRCQIHFIISVMDRLPKKNIENVRTELKDLFRIHNIEAARKAKMKILNQFEEKYLNICECLDSGFEDVFQFTATNSTLYNRLKSTKLLERLNQEIRRRERVTRIFPNAQSAERMIGSMLINIDEEWQTCDERYGEYNHLETTE